MDSNVEIVAPVVGDIGSCVAALLDGMGGNWPDAAGRLDRRGQPRSATRTSPRWRRG